MYCNSEYKSNCGLLCHICGVAMGLVVCSCCHEVTPHGAVGFSILDGAITVPFASICHFERDWFCVERGIGWGDPLDRIVAVHSI